MTRCDGSSTCRATPHVEGCYAGERQQPPITTTSPGYADEGAVQILLWAVRSNYIHPSGGWGGCQGCAITFDGKAILDDIREAGWEMRPR